MTTKLTVATETNGTLKQNNTNITRKLLHGAASFLMAGLALMIMSFTQDDTTKKAEMNKVSNYATTSIDSCCAVTFVNGIQHIVITNTNAFTAEVRINNMDLNTWVNSMMAYSFKRINLSSIGTADHKMDMNFTKAENMNRKMAVAYGHNIESEAVAADETISDYFEKAVAAPLFSNELTTEKNVADANMDLQFNDDAELRAKAALYGKTIETVNADDAMDFMVNAAGINHFSPAISNEADKQMDDLLVKTTFKSIRSSEATAADLNMDELVENRL